MTGSNFVHLYRRVTTRYQNFSYFSPTPLPRLLDGVGGGEVTLGTFMKGRLCLTLCTVGNFT